MSLGLGGGAGVQGSGPRVWSSGAWCEDRKCLREAEGRAASSRVEGQDLEDLRSQATTNPSTGGVKAVKKIGRLVRYLVGSSMEDLQGMMHGGAFGWFLLIPVKQVALQKWQVKRPRHVVSFPLFEAKTVDPRAPVATLDPKPPKSEKKTQARSLRPQTRSVKSRRLQCRSLSNCQC